VEGVYLDWDNGFREMSRLSRVESTKKGEFYQLLRKIRNSVGASDSPDFKATDPALPETISETESAKQFKSTAELKLDQKPLAPVVQRNQTESDHVIKSSDLREKEEFQFVIVNADTKETSSVTDSSSFKENLAVDVPIISRKGSKDSILSKNFLLKRMTVNSNSKIASPLGVSKEAIERDYKAGSEQVFLIDLGRHPSWDTSNVWDNG
jgi:hypothetical protein